MGYFELDDKSGKYIHYWSDLSQADFGIQIKVVVGILVFLGLVISCALMLWGENWM